MSRVFTEEIGSRMRGTRNGAIGKGSNFRWEGAKFQHFWLTVASGKKQGELSCRQLDIWDATQYLLSLVELTVGTKGITTRGKNLDEAVEYVKGLGKKMRRGKSTKDRDLMVPTAKGWQGEGRCKVDTELGRERLGTWKAEELL